MRACGNSVWVFTFARLAVFFPRQAVPKILLCLFLGPEQAILDALRRFVTANRGNGLIDNGFKLFERLPAGRAICEMLPQPPLFRLAQLASGRNGAEFQELVMGSGERQRPRSWLVRNLLS